MTDRPVIASETGDPDDVARMSAVDAMLWALDADPLLRSTITVVGVLDRSPGPKALKEHLEHSTRQFPRLRQRVVRSPIGVAPPRWELDPAFDLDYHLRTVGIPGSDPAADLVNLLEMAEPVATEGFDAARPPWRITFVEGLAGGRAGLIAKLHHALTDGVGAVRLAMSIFDLDRHPDRGPVPPRPDEPMSTGVERAIDDLDFEVRRTAALARRAVPRVARGLRDALVAPEAQLKGAVEWARSLARTTSPGTRPLSPLMAGRSLRTGLDVVSLALDDLRSAGKAAGGSVNDAFLAAVCGGLRRYHNKHGHHPEALRVGIAVNRRPVGADLFGNDFAPLRLLVPLQIGDPGERVASVGALVRRAREEPALDLLGTVAAAAGAVSRAASVAAVSATLRGTDVVASNVPGSPVSLYLAGARLERLVAFGPRSGAALNLTMLSYQDAVEVGVNADLLAIPDPETVVDCLRAGFDEVLALAPPPGR
jgi:diacylglycerol O-acyltransferase